MHMQCVPPLNSQPPEQQHSTQPSLPPLSWLDLGALHRTIKAGSLCAEPHPLSTYMRCKSRRAFQGVVCVPGAALAALLIISAEPI